MRLQSSETCPLPREGRLEGARTEGEEGEAVAWPGWKPAVASLATASLGHLVLGESSSSITSASVAVIFFK